MCSVVTPLCRVLPLGAIPQLRLKSLNDILPSNSLLNQVSIRAGLNQPNNMANVSAIKLSPQSYKHNFYFVFSNFVIILSRYLVILLSNFNLDHLKL